MPEERDTEMGVETITTGDIGSGKKEFATDAMRSGTLVIDAKRS